MKIRILPALDDNYMYLIIDENTQLAVVIDPVEHKTVLEALGEEKATLKAILTTHHHWDHSGGNYDLYNMEQFKDKIKVYGGDANIGALTDKIAQGDAFKIGDLNIKCLLTPCHTKGHICYFIEDQPGCPAAVFTGDTLFSGGCGKFFEGTAENMHYALNDILAGLPGNTEVYCGHEYTANNLKFAQHVEPDNLDIKTKLEWALNKRAAGEPSVPSTIDAEKKFNPFMRVTESDVQKHTGCTDPVDVMRKLREEKDNFRVPV